MIHCADCGELISEDAWVRFFGPDAQLMQADTLEYHCGCNENGEALFVTAGRTSAAYFFEPKARVPETIPATIYENKNGAQFFLVGVSNLDSAEGPIACAELINRTGGEVAIPLPGFFEHFTAVRHKPVDS